MNYTAEGYNSQASFSRGDVLQDMRYEANKNESQYLIIDEPTYPYVKVVTTSGKTETVSYSYLANSQYFVKKGRIDVDDLISKINSTIMSEIDNKIKNGNELRISQED